MRHIFLTGEIQCGKSTLIQSILHHSAGRLVVVGGFLTYFTTRIPDKPRILYLGNATIYKTIFQNRQRTSHIPPEQIHETLINQNTPAVPAAHFCGGSRPQVNLEAFESYGRIWIENGIKSALTIPHTPHIHPILIFDECGYLESNAPLFQQVVYESLDAPVPILGVVRQMTTTSWLDTIRQHPNVQLVTVTKTNRNVLVPELTEQLLSYVSSPLDPSF